MGKCIELPRTELERAVCISFGFFPRGMATMPENCPPSSTRCLPYTSYAYERTTMFEIQGKILFT